jgi:hypothetical protein
MISGDDAALAGGMVARRGPRGSDNPVRIKKSKCEDTGASSHDEALTWQYESPFSLFVVVDTFLAANNYNQLRACQQYC